MNPLKFLLFLAFISFVSACGYEEVDEVIEENSEELTQEVVELPVVDSFELEMEERVRSIITNVNVKQKLLEYGLENKENRVTIFSKFGKIKILLYNSTALHRANFIMLAKKNFYDNTLFYRVINDFMIQGGNSDDESLLAKLDAIGGYRIPNEINKGKFHKKGAIAMAVSPEEQNFGKKSSAINFYIIEGRKLPRSYFKEKKEEGKDFSEEQIKTYTTIGGAPHLDGNYTVFGEVTSGMRVLSKISNVKTDKYDWPIYDIVIDSIRAY